MKLLNDEINVVAGFDGKNKPPVPIKIKHKGRVVNVQQVVSSNLEKRCGKFMYLIRCQSEMDGRVVPYELKYDLASCTWYLYKI